ncbi:MAG: sigma-70 family RNA polymerase sigma factor [Planctomycetota bacterium]
MFGNTTDRAFRRFRRQGDPADLAAVFDRAAPELLRLGRHLASSEAAAEDLVQDTFLTAIRSAEDYDERLPVVPWLVGILANHARLARRRSRRTIDPDRLRSWGTADPLAVAAQRELEQELRGCIDRLPSSWQPVLQSYLLQGVGPGEIAERLGRPAGTVRGQISRGLKLLRASLPGSAAAVAALRLPDGGARGLPAVREHLLEQVGGVGVSAAVVAGAGAVAMPAKLVAALLPLGLLGGWLALGAAAGAPELPGSPSIVAPASPPAVAVAAERGDAGSAQGTPRSALAAATTAGSLTVTVRRARDGRPAPGVEVRVSGPAASPVAVQDTDEHGRAVLDAVPPGRQQIHVAGRSRPVGVVIEPGRRTDAVVELPRGLRVMGVVRDGGGRPVPNAAVMARGREWARDPWPREVARTDADGRFEVDQLPVRVELHAAAPGLARSSCKQLHGREGGDVRVDLALRGRGHQLRIRVVDPVGRALESPEIMLLPAGGGAPFGLVLTDDGGWWAATGLGAGDYLLLGRAEDTRLAPARTELTVRHDREVVLTLPAAAAVVGSVAARGEGMSGGFAVRAVRADLPSWLGALAQWFQVATVKVEAGESYRIAGLAPGSYRLRARRMAGGWLAVREVQVAAGSAVQWDLGPELPTGSVRARLSAGSAPLPGAPMIKLYRRDVGGGRRLVARERADARGRVAFAGLDASGRYDVAVTLPIPTSPDSSVVLARAERVRVTGSETEVFIPGAPAATLSGRVVDAAGVPVDNARVVVRAPAGWPQEGGLLTVTDASGAFAAGPLPAGAFELAVRDAEGRTALAACERLRQGESIALGDIAVH